MRVTQKILYDDFLRDINRNRSEMAKLHSDLSSGKRVRIPSQDPVAFQRSRGIEENLRKSEQYQDNISSGLRQARLAQEALDEVIERLIDVKRISTQGATDTLSANDRKILADEIRGLRDTMVSTLNMSYGDRYLFAGTNSGEKPFVLDDSAPGGVLNQSNGKAPMIVAADGVKVDISVTGQELTQSQAGDMFELLSQIEQGLRDNDSSVINGLLGSVDEMIDQVSIVTSRLGGNINRMEFMFEQFESAKIGLQADISRLVDTDYAQAISDMQRNQIAFESAMAVHTRMINNTLLDYL